MQALVCELCKGNSFTKADDLYQCDFCRTKYTVEQAKKLVVEGTVTVDRGNEAGNILSLAQNSFYGGSFEQAQVDARRVLEIDPSNGHAHLLVGLAKLHQGATLTHAREARREFELAISHANETDAPSFKQQIIETIRSTVSALGMRQQRMQARQLPSILGLAAAYIDLLKLAYFYSGDVQFAIAALEVSNESIPWVKVARKPSEMSALFVTQEELNAAFKTHQEIAAVVRQRDPKYRIRTPKAGSAACFVVTATMGGEANLPVETLRDLRDEVLSQSRAGRDFTRWYYIHGPRIAEIISTSLLLRTMSFLLIVLPATALAVPVLALARRGSRC